MALNKGEWSEVYVFLKLLADGKLYAADKDLNKIEEIYYPILKVLKEGTSGDLEFLRNSHIKVIDKDGNLLIELTIEEFKEKSIELLHKIQSSKKRTFEVPSILSFMHSIKITKLKENSKEKRDITLVVHDLFTGHNPTLGFSIKSRLGSPSTLINASGSTNFIYRLSTPLDSHTIQEINNIDSNSKIRERIIKIIDWGSDLQYYGMQNEKFEQNLMMIDSQFPVMVSEILKLFYNGQGNTISALVEKLKVLNPCNFNLNNNHPYYEYKIKNFLTDSALGMTANTIWTGHYDANGGYIIVKEDGDILCYHIYNRNEFQDYLYDNTKLETPSSTKHGFGKIYEDNGIQLFKLNLQVRFI